MESRGVALYPTLAAVESISAYRGWEKDKDPPTERIQQKRKAFQTALSSGVIIGFGGDVGVYTHGTNVIELELMVEYGMKAIDALKAATSVNAKVFDLGDRGQLAPQLRADIIVVRGDPAEDITALRDVQLVVKNGEVTKNL